LRGEGLSLSELAIRFTAFLNTVDFKNDCYKSINTPNTTSLKEQARRVKHSSSEYIPVIVLEIQPKATPAAPDSKVHFAQQLTEFRYSCDIFPKNPPHEEITGYSWSQGSAYGCVT
jgi:hypothetical protein